MIDSFSLATAQPKSTFDAGRSLAASLYDPPLTIGLSGELGAGKTTFLQGFLEGLGVEGNVVSPTYALEQQYHSPTFGEVIHLDLYRLNEADAQKFLEERDDHAGIRCIEWVERAGAAVLPHIQIAMREEQTGRRIDFTCEDCDWPEDLQIEAWRREVHLPENVGAHCDTVAEVCDNICTALHARGVVARPALVRAAARLHDLFRFVDFRGNAGANGNGQEDQETLRIWQHWRDNLSATTHEEACTTFLERQGFPAVASIVSTHGLMEAEMPRTTIEQHILFYADKRAMHDRIVTVEERFRDFITRYGGGKESPMSQTWKEASLAVERLLFPEGVPF